MKKFLSDLLDSFKIGETGLSSRKLTAFVIVILVIIIHTKWLMTGNLSQLEMVLTIDYAFISALFGMTTFTSLKSFNSKDDKTDKSDEKTKDEEVK
jgi:hypothetical protein